MGRRPSNKKNEFENLDQDFKDTISNMNNEEIRKKIAEVALNEHENKLAQKKDEDLKRKIELVKCAKEPYTEATKMNRYRISYAHYILNSRGNI